MKKLLSTLFTCVLLASCMGDPVEQAAPITADGDAQLVLRLNTPKSFGNPATRGFVNIAEENRIDDIYVFIFDDNDILTGIYEGKMANDETHVLPVEDGVSGRGTFSVTLPRTPAGEKVTMMVLANVNSNHPILPNTIGFDLDAMNSKDYDDIIAAITCPEYGNLASDGDLPAAMWGEIEDVEIKPGINSQTVQLVRSYARVDVGVGTPTLDEDTGLYTWDGKDANGGTIPFELEHTYTFRTQSAYTVVPARANRNPAKPTIVGSRYSIEESIDNSLSNRYFNSNTITFYLPESDVVMGGTPGDANHENRLALVVGGYFDGSSTLSYYRLDYAKDGKLMNILRNHLYQFNISKVSGPGFATPEEAYSSSAMNMTAEVVDWADIDMGNIWMFGPDYFSIDAQEAVLEFNKGSQYVFNIKSTMDFEVTCGGAARLSTRGARSWSSAYYKYDLRIGYDQRWTLTVTALTDNLTTVLDMRPEDLHIVASGGKGLNVPLTVSQQQLETAPTQPLGLMAGILYFAPDGTLSIAEWDNSTVRRSNMAYFKFGSVIGFDGNWHNGSESWPADGSAIHFNPTNLVYGNQITGYSPSTYNAATSNSLPYIPGYDGRSVAMSVYERMSVSSPNYATVANLKAGRGDPCMLVGYTGAQLRAMNDGQLQTVLNNAAYRLPTFHENHVFTGAIDTGPNDYLYTPGHFTTSAYDDRNTRAFQVGRFPALEDAGGGDRFLYSLPVADTRHERSGSMDDDGDEIRGRYWSSNRAVDNNGDYVDQAYAVVFDEEYLYPNNSANFSYGMSIRCHPIRKTGQYSVSVSATDGGSVSVPSFTGPAGSTFTVTATPPAGLFFDRWETSGNVMFSNAFSAETTVTVQGNATIVAKFKAAPPYILYFDNNNVLRVGSFDNTTVRVDNMAFFKFGSVIGFDNKLRWDRPYPTAFHGDVAIRFNPTGLLWGTHMTSYAAADYDPATSNALPYIPGYTSADRPKSVSAPDYATAANVRAGRGDPCKLVGYSADQIRAMSDAQLDAMMAGAPYRLPTAIENVEFVGSGDNIVSYPYLTTRAGVETDPHIGRFPVVSNAMGAAYSLALPFAGFRYTRDGSVSSSGGTHELGTYWTSELVAHAPEYAAGTYFSTYNGAYPNMSHEYSYGFSVRCVPNKLDMVTVRLIAEEGGKITNSVSSSSTFMVPRGTRLSLTAVPDEGYAYYGFAYDNGYMKDASDTETIYPDMSGIVQDNTTIRARFVKPLILYFDEQGVLRADKFDNRVVKVSNMAFFKFGSVIGFDNNEHYGSHEWPDDGSAIHFNPTNLVWGRDITGYAVNYAEPGAAWSGDDYHPYLSNALPNIPGYTMADREVGYDNISISQYASVANLREGRGDPCKLVGYSGAQLRAMTDAQLQAVLNNARYKTPNKDEQYYFFGSSFTNDNSFWRPNSETADNPAVGMFPNSPWFDESYYGNLHAMRMPAAGLRDAATGRGYYVGSSDGDYWSGDASDMWWDCGYHVQFYKGGYYSYDAVNYHSYGMAVRCTTDGYPL
jgi:hypothetical protein